MKAGQDRSASGQSERGAGLFPNTHWSIVQRAGSQSSTALNALFTQYRPAMLAYLVARGDLGSQAEDRVQGFCLHLLQRDFLANVGREKGKFRTFLLNSLQNYIRDQCDRETALKRGAGSEPDSLEETGSDGQPLHDPEAGTPSADVQYDRAWAQAILQNALRRLHEECGRTGHAPLCQALEPVLYQEDTAPSYREVAERLGMTEGAVKVAAHRIRARLKRLIREETLQTVASPQDLEEELGYLISLFARK